MPKRWHWCNVHRNKHHLTNAEASPLALLTALTLSLPP